MKLWGRPVPRWGYHSGECRGERRTGGIMRGRGWRAVLCFSPQSCGVSPRFLGAIGSPFRGDARTASVWDTGTGGARSGCAPPTGGEGNIISHNLFNYVNFIPRKEAANSFLPMPCICAIRCNRVASAVTRQTVLCTTPFSFGMRKLEKSILWHTVCINRKRGVCSRRSVYAASPRSG